MTTAADFIVARITDERIEDISENFALPAMLPCVRARYVSRMP
jgi:hypothetical protein